MLLPQNQIYWSNDQTAFYLSQVVQSHHVFDLMLNTIERADELIVSSFAITETFIRRLVYARNRIKQITLILDFTIASRNPAMICFAAEHADRLLLTNNHSKTIYLRDSRLEMLAVMSNNATNNQRFESGIILKNHPVIGLYRPLITQTIEQAAPWIS